MKRKNYCYALMVKKTNKFLLRDGRLPIYWLKRIANEELTNFPNCYVEKINLDELLKFVLTHPY
jgi:hypothetical protein